MRPIRLKTYDSAIQVFKDGEEHFFLPEAVPDTGRGETADRRDDHSLGCDPACAGSMRSKAG